MGVVLDREFSWYHVFHYGEDQCHERCWLMMECLVVQRWRNNKLIRSSINEDMHDLQLLIDMGDCYLFLIWTIYLIIVKILRLHFSIRITIKERKLSTLVFMLNQLLSDVEKIFIETERLTWGNSIGEIDDICFHLKCRPWYGEKNGLFIIFALVYEVPVLYSRSGDGDRGEVNHHDNRLHYPGTICLLSTA